MSSELGIGDWIAITRGMQVGQQGEIIDEYDPLDGGPPILTINLEAGGTVDVSADRVQRTRRRRER